MPQAVTPACSIRLWRIRARMGYQGHWPLPGLGVAMLGCAQLGLISVRAAASRGAHRDFMTRLPSAEVTILFTASFPMVYWARTRQVSPRQHLIRTATVSADSAELRSPSTR